MSKKVLILASFIGSGHKKAAEAIQVALKELEPGADAEIVNFFQFAHPQIAKAISEFYFKLLHSDPKIWDYIYDPQEGKAKIAEMSGLKGLIKGIKVKRTLDYAFNYGVESEIRNVVENGSGSELGMRELLQMLGAKSEIAEEMYDDKNDKFRFPYSLIEEKLRILRKLGQYLLFRMEELVVNYKPDVIVCTQVLPCMFVAKLKEKLKINIPLIGVITDFGVHSYWTRPGVDIFIVPYPEMSKILLSRNIPRTAIYEYGIPIDRKFSKVNNRSELRRKFGLNPDLFTVLFMGGGTGFCIDLLGTLKKCEEEKLPLQIMLVAGENEDLKLEMEKMKELMSVPFFVFGFVDNVDEMMAASDLIVTKPGGLTIAESLVSSLPMILVRVIRGQEDNNLKFLLAKGVGVDGGKGEKVWPIIRDFLENPRKLKELKNKAREMAYPDSAVNISKLILSLAEKSVSV
jgi:processive 1,2-diacylglycerol beta-glucosyltransferase